MSYVLLSKEECEFVKSFFIEDEALDGKDPLIIDLDSKNTLSIKRKASAKYLDISNAELVDFLLMKLSPIGIVSISNRTVKLVRYSKGDYFEKHTDFYKYGNGANFKTLVIQLSASDEYEGGNLLVKDVSQNRELGSFALFNSSDVHEVTEVTYGVRFSLTLFLMHKDFFRTLSLI
jgi:predicted 2-oxoglutarate/Fe(II)-dependent dioxygenase YbiX